MVKSSQLHHQLLLDWNRSVPADSSLVMEYPHPGHCMVRLAGASPMRRQVVGCSGLLRQTLTHPLCLRQTKAAALRYLTRTTPLSVANIVRRSPALETQQVIITDMVNNKLIVVWLTLTSLPRRFQKVLLDEYLLIFVIITGFVVT